MFEETYNSATFDTLLSDDYQLVSVSRRGIRFRYFLSIVEGSPFDLHEWGQFLRLSETALCHLRQQNQPLDTSLSERVLDISRVLRQGESVFGNRSDFRTWLETSIPALGSIQPKSLLDNTFGIEILRDELTRIEHGVLA